MPEVADIRAKIRQYITVNFYTGSMEIRDDTSLVAAGVIDSTGVFELLEFLQKTFRIDIPQEDLLPENFESIDGITGYVATRAGDRRKEEQAL